MYSSGFFLPIFFSLPFPPPPPLRAATDDDTVGVSFFLFSGRGGGRKHFIPNFFDTFLDLAYTSTQKKTKCLLAISGRGGKPQHHFGICESNLLILATEIPVPMLGGGR